MKKIFKALAITAASAAMCVGIGVASGCNGGNGTFEGSYHYTNQYGATYGMVVEVTVENNIITKVVDKTNTDLSKQDNKTWTKVSPGWEDYFEAGKGWLLYTTASDAMKDLPNIGDYKEGVQYIRAMDKDGNVSFTEFVEWDGHTLPEPIQTGVYSYGWSNAASSNWTNNESYLLQKYEGWSVADILDIQVFIKETGEPYEKDKNNGFDDLLITGSTQGSGRLLLAIQDALGKKTEIGRIELPKADD